MIPTNKEVVVDSVQQVAEEIEHTFLVTENLIHLAKYIFFCFKILNNSTRKRIAQRTSNMCPHVYDPDSETRIFE